MLGYGPALFEIVSTTWEDLTGAPLRAEEPSRILPLSGETLTTVVGLTAGWEGAIAITGSMSTVEKAAAELFGADQPSPDDLACVLATIGTKVAEDFKLMLPASCSLVPAKTTNAQGFRVAIPGFAEVLSEGFRSGTDCLLASVLQRLPSGPRP